MKKLILILLLMTTPAWADYLGCFEPNEAVEIKTLYLSTLGVLTDPTSPACDILDPNDTTLTSCTSGPTKVGSLIGIYESSHTIPASPLEGVWIVKQKGTVDGTVRDGADYFMVVDAAGECPGRTGVKSVINDVGITQAGADKAWGTTVRAITDIPAGAITSSEAPNLDAAVSSRSTLTVTDNIGINLNDTSGTLNSTEIPKLDAANSDIDDGVWSVGTRTITGGTIGTYTGNTPQTGDAYVIVNNGTYGNSALNTKLGTPVGASMTEDIADLKTDTTILQSRIPESLLGGRMACEDGIPIIINSTNTSTAFSIPVDSTTSGVIDVDNDYRDNKLCCHGECHYITASDQNTIDTITTDQGDPWLIAPGNGSDEICYIK